MSKLKDNKFLMIGIGIILVIIAVVVMIATGVLKISEKKPDNVTEWDNKGFEKDEDFFGTNEEFLEGSKTFVSDLSNIDNVYKTVQNLRNYKEILSIKSTYLNSNYTLEREITVDSLDNKKFYMKDRRGLSDNGSGFNGSEYELINTDSNKHLRINTKSPIDTGSYPEGKWIQVPSDKYPELNNEGYTTFVDEFLVGTLPLLIQDLSTYEIIEKGDKKVVFKINYGDKLTGRIGLAYGFYANLGSQDKDIKLEIYLDDKGNLNYKVIYSNGEILYTIARLDGETINVDNIMK